MNSTQARAQQQLPGAVEALRKIHPGLCCEPFLMRAHAAPSGWVSHFCNKAQGHDGDVHECECGYSWKGGAL